MVLKRRNDELGEIISREMGAPPSIARAEQAGIGAVISSRRSRPSRSFAFDYP
ncbi:hypothetical protein IE4771_PD00600 (plasmid) [Rhizobium etli bv. mimosae str. IE4771]|uniref:Uncharacterized protein n=1 Tax=Rhizobium etli bv. mimosae str. IE4771 TaxID=1432050 RepID=A0A060IBZ2_RHIET|nr:hypothetical protein IE4771_PD00600 [Rhizobium sp. IE4771]